MNHKRFYVLQNQEGGGTGGGTGGSDNGDIEAKIKAAVDEATTGLAAKNKELLGELKTAKESLKKFDGIDLEEVKLLMARFSNDEEAKLLKDGKIDELLEKRYAKRDQEWQRKLEAAVAERDAAKAKADKFLASVLDDRLRAAFLSEVDPRSMKAAMLEAKQIFTLNEEGVAVQLDKDGQIVLGKDGKTPFSPAEWIKSDTVRKESPYLFTATGSGSGATQSGTASSSADLMKLPPAQRMDAARKTT